MKILKEESKFDNGFFEFLKTEEEHTVNKEKVVLNRTMVRRPPGIRALIIDKNEKILMSKEFRYELDDWDFRLPGGKVFESVEDYKKSLNEDMVMDIVYKTVFKEVLEEVGLIVKNPKLIKVSKDGAGVIWDLYYFEITDYAISKDGARLEKNEFVNGYEWYTFEEIIKLCHDNKIHEDRTVGVLLTYILNNKKERDK